MKMQTKAGIIFIGIFISFLAFGCRSKKTVSGTNQSDKTQPIHSVESSDYTKATGKISLRYKSACGTVIISNTPTEKDTAILTPTPALTGFDTEGMEVTFSYRKLRIHNPKGCAGIPVQIFDIKKK
jgi:hypothetical protein